MPSHEDAPVVTKLQLLAARVRQHPEEPLHNVLNLLRRELLADCFRSLRQEAASGVDAVT